MNRELEVGEKRMLRGYRPQFTNIFGVRFEEGKCNAQATPIDKAGSFISCEINLSPGEIPAVDVWVYNLSVSVFEREREAGLNLLFEVVLFAKEGDGARSLVFVVASSKL